MKNLFFYLMAFLASSVCHGQEQSSDQADTLRKDALNVYYVEASSYVKENIPYINYVRDRRVADLVIISASEGTGSGGREYTLFLEGQLKCVGMQDTLKYSMSPDDTYEQGREELVKTLKKGLVRYVMKTPLSEYIDVRFNKPMPTKVSTDKWNNWVFRLGVNGHGSGESMRSSNSISGNISASKVTEDWKFNMYGSYRTSKSIYDIDGLTYENSTQSRSANTLLVRSISDHWSIGGSSSISSSTYSNYDLHFNVSPGIEYDLFPYSESTRRQLRILYSLGYTYNNYTDTTIFDKMEEGLFSQSLSAAFQIVQKWGDINIDASWSNYLRDFSENSASIFGSVSWRVVKGLRINMGGGYSFIHNQISLVKGGSSTEEILLHMRELKTEYSFHMSFGLSYTFGSIYNNVVNPRFGGGGGGGYVIIY